MSVMVMTCWAVMKRREKYIFVRRVKAPRTISMGFADEVMTAGASPATMPSSTAESKSRQMDCGVPRSANWMMGMPALAKVFDQKKSEVADVTS